MEGVVVMGNLDVIKAMQATCQNEVVSPGKGDPEIRDMNLEADLLGAIQSDTGETGRKCGNRIDFTHCPVCGHTDCFRFYPDTNSWTCFSDSNNSGYTGGKFTEYMKAAHNCDDSEAVRRLREVTGHPLVTSSSINQDSEEGVSRKLPSWRGVKASDPPARNPVLIPGILRRGHVAVMTGKGKVGKTQSAVQLAIAVATGGEWFGHKIESCGKVLHLDPECDPKSLDNRYSYVCGRLGVSKSEVDRNVCQWPLRGVEDATIEKVRHDLENHSRYGEFSLIILDSASTFVRGDENSSVDVRRFSAEVMRIAKVTGAAVWCVHHFGKTKDGDRSAADRARGSSVWLDFPDASLTITETFPPSGEVSDFLEDGECGVILESGGLREFPRMYPVRLVFDGRIHRLDSEGITEGWKANSSQTAGGKQTGELNKARSERDWLNMQLQIVSECLKRGGEMSMTEAASLVGTRSDTLRNSFVNKGSDLLTYDKREGRNYVVLKSAKSFNDD